MSRTKKNKKLHRKTSKPKRKKGIKLYILLFFMIIISSLLAITYVHTKTITIHEHPIRLSNLPALNHGLKIVHFSDLHYGGSFSGDDINRLVTAINQTNPDLIVFTGDLIERTVSRTEERLLIEGLNQLDPMIGTYAVLGEIDGQRALDIFEQTNITVLQNELTRIYTNSPTPLFLYGVDFTNPDFEALVDAAETVRDHIVIVLTHHPDHFNKLNDLHVDLVLAGHSHNGQINIPFFDLWNRIDRNIIYNRPFYQLDDTRLYTSAGIGTKYIPLRFGAPSSFNLYRLLASD